MNAKPLQHRSAIFGHSADRKPRTRSAFTLIEIIIAVTLTSVIVIGLMAMFTQTQKAFRLGMNQKDVLEAGRVATDMIVRELEQTAPSHLPWWHVNSTNFYVGAINSDNFTPISAPAVYTPFVQSLPGTGPAGRTNVLQNLYFVTRENQTWRGIGYFVRLDDTFRSDWGPVGTLYRMETPASAFEYNNGGIWPFAAFLNSTNNISKILEGVVHFTARAYDTNGYWITPSGRGFSPVSWHVRTNYCREPLGPGVADPTYVFSGAAVPAFIELEVGILENQTYERYRAIPVEAEEARNDYLRKHAGNVHVFRQRISIRNVDVTAYQ